MHFIVSFCLLTALSAFPTWAQTPSKDGTCGGFFAYTCTGNTAGVGQCCSLSKGTCGSDATTCGSDCDPNFGTCSSSATTGSAGSSNNGAPVPQIGSQQGPQAQAAAFSAYSASSSSAALMSMSTSSLMSSVMLSTASSAAMAMPTSTQASTMASYIQLYELGGSAAATTMSSTSSAAMMAMDGTDTQPSSISITSNPSSTMTTMMMMMPQSISAYTMDPYNATVTVTNCTGRATPTSMSAPPPPPTTTPWFSVSNASVPVVTASICHKCLGGASMTFTGGSRRVVGVSIGSMGLLSIVGVTAGVVGGLWC